MKLYYATPSCTLATHIIIYELGLSCDMEAVSLKTKKTASGIDYFSINAKGTVPCLILEDGQTLTETAVILQYLADLVKATKLLPPVGDFQRYRVLEWLNFLTTDLHKHCSPLFNPQVSNEMKETVFKPLLESKLRIANMLLGDKTYVMGSYLTLGDGYLFAICSWLVGIKIYLKDYPNLLRHYYTMKARPSVLRAAAEQGVVI